MNHSVICYPYNCLLLLLEKKIDTYVSKVISLSVLYKLLVVVVRCGVVCTKFIDNLLTTGGKKAKEESMKQKVK